MPSSRSRRIELERLGALPFAHRGLHGGGTVENSLGAIEAAAAGGYGIEIDVRLSRDGVAMVFHDERLDRLTSEQGRVVERTAAALQALRLAGSRDCIPRLTEALRAIGGRVPLLIEVKARGQAWRLCRAVAADLADYQGPVGVMSFNPHVPHWFSWRAPRILRGLVVTESGKEGWRGAAERRLAWAWSRADFAACDVRDLPSAFSEARRTKGVPVYTWTVRSDDDGARAAAHADQIIFEAPGA
jgi:glycerophosphoryl diester phosphodiesterase